MVDDYTAKMTELIELMRLIGNDTQQCEVKECKRKISSTITDTLSAFSNGSGGWIILGLSEKNGFTPVEGFDARAMQEALSQACEKMTPVVRPVIVTCPFEGANLVFARIDEMLPRDKPCFTTALGPHGGSFIRTGDGDRRMTSYEVDRLIEEHLQPTYDLDIVPGPRPMTSTRSLLPDCWRACANSIRACSPTGTASMCCWICRCCAMMIPTSRRSAEYCVPPWPDCWRWAAIRRSSIRGSAFR